MKLKPWGNRSEATKAQNDRMTRLHQAMAPFRKTVAGYKKLQNLLPAVISVRIGKTAKECAVSVSTLTDEKPSIVEALIKRLVNASNAGANHKKTKKVTSNTVTEKKTVAVASTLSTKKLVDSMSLDEINKAAPYKLKKLKNGEYAVMLGAIQYMRFDGIVWARYYCEELNKGYRDILRDLKTGRAK